MQMERLVMRCHGENETGDDAKLQGFQEIIYHPVAKTTRNSSTHEKILLHVFLK